MSKFSAEIKRIAIVMWTANATQSEIDEAIGASQDAVRRWARAAGVPPKQAGGVRDPAKIAEAIEAAAAERALEQARRPNLKVERGYVCQADCGCLLCQLQDGDYQPRRSGTFALRLDLL